MSSFGGRAPAHPAGDARGHREEVAASLERRARKLAGGIHVHGAIPASFWRQAFCEFLGEPTRDPEWAEAMIERWAHRAAQPNPRLGRGG